MKPGTMVICLASIGLGALAGERLHVLAASHRDEPAGLDRERLRLRRWRIHRVDLGVEDDEIGGGGVDCGKGPPDGPRRADKPGHSRAGQAHEISAAVSRHRHLPLFSIFAIRRSLAKERRIGIVRRPARAFFAARLCADDRVGGVFGIAFHRRRGRSFHLKCGRQPHREPRPLAFLAFDRDLAAMEVDDHLHEIEADASADDAGDVAAAVISFEQMIDVAAGMPMPLSATSTAICFVLVLGG